MRVDVEIVGEDQRQVAWLADSSELMAHFLRRGTLLGGARCLPRIRPDQPTEFQQGDLPGLLADFVCLMDLAGTDKQREHLEALIELLDEALSAQGYKVRFIPQAEGNW